MTVYTTRRILPDAGAAGQRRAPRIPRFSFSVFRFQLSLLARALAFMEIVSKENW